MVSNITNAEPLTEFQFLQEYQFYVTELNVIEQEQLISHENNLKEIYQTCKKNDVEQQMIQLSLENSHLSIARQMYEDLSKARLVRIMNSSYIEGLNQQSCQLLKK